MPGGTILVTLETAVEHQSAKIDELLALIARANGARDIHEIDERLDAIISGLQLARGRR